MGRWEAREGREEKGTQGLVHSPMFKNLKDTLTGVTCNGQTDRNAIANRLRRVVKKEHVTLAC